jgi:hypothetical protein
MPIRHELRHFYRGPGYRAWRAALVERAGNKCEQCRKPNGACVETATPLNVLGLRMAWRLNPHARWRDQTGKVVRRLTHVQALRERIRSARLITVVLTAAHLNHTPGDDRLENGRLLCQWCHLNYDRLHHKETRTLRKDAARPLLREALEWGREFEALGRSE